MKNEKILIPVLENEGMNSKISLHFGHAPFLAIYNKETRELEIVKNDLDHSNNEKNPIEQIIEKINPEMLFVKEIGRRALNTIKQKGLKVTTGPYEIVKEVIENLEKLETQEDSCNH